MEDQRPDDSTIAVLGGDEANLELRVPGHQHRTFSRDWARTIPRDHL